MQDLTELKITYEELFELLDLNTTAYNSTQYTDKEVYVNTPSGFKRIKAGVVKENLDMINVKYSNNTECNVAKKHIFSCNGNEIFAEDAKEVDTKNGTLKITKKTNIGKHDGYDINIDYPHWYYSENDVIYHNTLLMIDMISGHIKEGKNVLLVSMEMQDREIMKRVHANALDLNINRLTSFQKHNGYSPDEIRAAKEKIQSNGKFYVKDFPAGSFSPLMLDNLLDEFEVEKGIKFDIVYLDYLGIMKSDLLSPSAGLYSYVKSIVEETRSIASKRAIPIVSASQLNRGATGSNLKIQDVGNESISDSLGSAMTADFILFLLQTPQMKEENIITCKVTKNRFTGRTDRWNMNVDYTRMRFSDAIVQDDLGMSEKQVNEEIKIIQREDIEKIKKHDNSLNEEFDIMTELGLNN